MGKFKVGNKYVVVMKDERSVDVLHEYSIREHLAYNISNALKGIVKAAVVIISVVFPPLLLITIPLIKRGNK